MNPGTYTASVPHRVLYHTAAEKQRWSDTWDEWERSNRTDWSAWREFEPIARSAGFPLGESGGGHFAESRVAKELHDAGYTYWHANRCHLFLKHNRGGISKPQTDIVERKLREQGHPYLRDYGKRVQPKLRDVDLVGHHPDHGWRFCEVKWKTERLRPGQLETLAFLNLLVGATVEVVRVVPDSDGRNWPTEQVCTFTVGEAYLKGEEENS